MRHTPVAETKDIDILTFEESRKIKENSLNYDRKKWIYYPDFYSEYRYILGTIGDKPIITIGINPSTAEPNKSDPTIDTVQALAKNNNYDSYIMCNVYAQRSTDSSKVDSYFNEKLHQENLKAFRWIFENTKESPIIWAAWGTNIERRDYLKDCLQDIVTLSAKYNSKWVKAGELTVKGHPHHPLFLKHDTYFDSFDVDSYLKNLGD